MNKRGVATRWVVFGFVFSLAFALAFASGGVRDNNLGLEGSANEAIPVDVASISGGGDFELKENLEKYNERNSDRNDFVFSGVVRHYSGNDLKSSDVFLRGKNLDSIDLNRKKLDDLGYRDLIDNFVFELDLISPTEELFVGSPAIVDVEFDLTDDYKEWFEERGFELTMKSCDLSVEDTLEDSSYFVNLFTNDFQKSHSVPFAAGTTYKIKVVCEHETGMMGASRYAKFIVDSGNSPAGGEEDSSLGSGHACETPWSCTDWSPCVDGQRFRSCEKQDGNRFCYADPSFRPAESESCSPEFENLAQDVESEGAQGLASRITGAVVGAAGNVGYMGAAFFIVLLVVAYGLVRARTRNHRR